MVSPCPGSGPPTESPPRSVGGHEPRLLRGGAFFLLLSVSLLSVSLLLIHPSPIRGQEWNDTRVLQMVRDARLLRQGTAQDPDFQSYSSSARGYVHFFLHREDTGERILVKTDQIALEVYWKAPNQIRQRIVGLRDEKSLPTNIRYHLDHLVVVQDEFGDLIRIGQGDEIQAVLHPVAPGSEAFYDFLLADSITLNLANPAREVRVYEVQVRPRNPDIPGFIGSVYLDRDTRAIVRMSFTFTPASYEDPYLDHIRISLENGLWEGKYWLPYRQELEIRREVPWLDIPAGTVIKGWFEVGEYQINPDLPDALFRGPAITTVPEAQRRSFPFEEGIHEHLDREGLSPPPSMEEIEAMARKLARDQFLTGLKRFRFHLPDPMVSSALRYNRAEGLFVGAGASYGLRPWLSLAGDAGYSAGRERPFLRFRIAGGERSPGTSISAYWNRPRDIGPVPAISGVMNSLSTLLLENDYSDLAFTTGAEASHTWNPGDGIALDFSARWESHDHPRNEISSGHGDTEFRPIFPVQVGEWKSLAGLIRFSTPFFPLLTTEAGALVGDFGGRGFGRVTGALRYHRLWLGRGLALDTDLTGGALLGDPPPQALFLLGGRETVPGYPFRSRVGDGYWLWRAEATYSLLPPFLSLRALGAAGGTTGNEDAVTLPDPWPAAGDASTMTSLGVGVGLGWDVIRLDLARGLGEGGDWAWVLSVNHEFWSWL